MQIFTVDRPSHYHNWMNPRLKMLSERVDLRPLMDDEVLDLGGAMAISKGIPGVIAMIAADADNSISGILDNACIDIIDGVPLESQGEVRMLMETFCILTVIDPERARVVLDRRYPDHNYLECSVRDIKDHLHKLIRYGLISWDINKGGYKMREPARSLYEEYLWQTNRGLWGSLHGAAQELYADWENKYRNKELWGDLKSYHEEVLTSDAPRDDWRF